MVMTKIYNYDFLGIYNGISREITEMDGIPPNWTDVLLPPIPDGKFASFVFPDWHIIDEYPQIPIRQISANSALSGQGPTVI
jgi:hypothetical protein